MLISELKAGDILTYKNGQEHIVNTNKEFIYRKYYHENLKNISNDNLDIIKVQRYKKSIFGLYRLKTIFRS